MYVDSKVLNRIQLTYAKRLSIQRVQNGHTLPKVAISHNINNQASGNAVSTLNTLELPYFSATVNARDNHLRPCFSTSALGQTFGCSYVTIIQFKYHTCMYVHTPLTPVWNLLAELGLFYFAIYHS